MFEAKQETYFFVGFIVDYYHVMDFPVELLNTMNPPGLSTNLL